VWHRTAVKLSFAHAEGRNYRQLPDRARLREEPSPADIVYSNRYRLSNLHVSGEMRFSAREYQLKGYLGSICALAAGSKWAAADTVGEDRKLPLLSLGI
jgi:hypothetical protein